MRLSILEKKVLTDVGKCASQNFYISYSDKPIEFCIEILEINPTDEQKIILESIRDRPITNVKAAHGVGKSLIAAVCVLWWVFAVGGIAITTAPTESQVKQILWAEIRKLYDAHKDKLGGHRGELFVRLSEEARAYGFTSRNYDSNSFQGKHAEKQLIIEDEADGITETVDDGFKSCLTGSKNRGLRIGNPLDPQSNFAKSCELDKAVITISAWRHPNIAWAYELHPDGIHRLKPEIAELIIKDGELIPQDEWNSPLLQKDIIPGAISVSWIEDVRRTKFENSPFWCSRVEGNYPGDSTDGIVPKSLLYAARQRYDSNPCYWDNLASRYRWQLGLDVADGVDNNALSLWRGPVLYNIDIFPTKGDLLDTERAAQMAKDAIASLGGDYSIAVDNTGVGAGSLAILKKRGYLAIGCKFGKAATKPNQYNSRKAELYWSLREGLRKGKIAIAPLPDEKRIFEEIAATRYYTNTKDQICCEPKEKTVARLGRSPDAGDATVIALESGIDWLEE